MKRWGKRKRIMGFTAAIMILLIAITGCAGGEKGSDGIASKGAGVNQSESVNGNANANSEANNNASGNTSVGTDQNVSASAVKEPQIFLNGKDLSRTIDNFSFGEDQNHIYLEEVGLGSFTIYETRLKEGKWSEPTVPGFVDPQYSEGTAILSGDGSKVYFHSFRPNPLEGAPRELLDIWVAERKGEAWEEAKPLGIPRVTASDFYYYPSITAEGTVYFTSVRSDGLGEEDIYRSQYVNGAYTEPEHLGKAINSPSVDGYPHISSDESILLFSRLNDLYMSRRIAGEWIQAQKLNISDYGIRRSRSPLLSEDKQTLYFVGEEGGTASIYQMDLPELALDQES